MTRAKEVPVKVKMLLECPQDRQSLLGLTWPVSRAVYYAAAKKPGLRE